MKTAKFKDSPLGPIPQDWEVKRLGEIVEINPIDDCSLPDEFVYIDLESVKEGQLLQKNIIQAKDAPSRAQRLFRYGDVLFQTVRPYQKNNLFVNFDASEFVASTGYAILRERGNVSDSRYIYNYLHTETFVADVLDKCTGTSYPAINPNALSMVPIALPPLPEQRRIAEALGEMDRLIELLDAQIVKKRRIAQGLAHDLLGMKNEECGMRNEPIRRLPGFKGEWVKKRLGEMLTLGHGKDYKGLTNGDVPVYGTGGLMCFVNEYLYDGPTVCIGRKGTIDAPIYHEGKIWTVDTLFYSHSFIDADPKFIYYTFCSIDWKSFNEASGVPSLSSMIIEGIEVFVPPTIAEQRAIAEVLSEMDAAIGALETKRDKYMRIKEGVMRDLLSGKKRLKGE